MTQTTVRQKGRAKAVSRKLTLASLFAALYAALVNVFAQTSVLPVQVRFADALMPLAMLFGPPVIIGLSIGAFVGNLGADLQFGLSTSTIGTDMILGGLANLIAGTVAWKLSNFAARMIGRRRGWFIGSMVETLIISFIVGSYLFYLLGIPAQITLFGASISGWLASTLGVLAGSIIAVNILGFILLVGVSRAQIIKGLRSNGLIQTDSED